MWPSPALFFVGWQMARGVVRPLEAMSRAARRIAGGDLDFDGAIAHDLRTPLFTLRAHLHGLQKGIAVTPEKVRDYVDECAARADALERLVGDRFAFTRLEYLEQEPERAAGVGRAAGSDGRGRASVGRGQGHRAGAG